MNPLMMESSSNNMWKMGSWGSVKELLNGGDQFSLSSGDEIGSPVINEKILGDAKEIDQVGLDHLDFLDDYLASSTLKNESEKVQDHGLDANDFDFPEWLENKIDFSILDNFDNIDRILDEPILGMEEDELAKLSNTQLDEKLELPLLDQNEKAENISLSVAPLSPPYSLPSSPEGLVPDNSAPCSPLIDSPPNFGNLLLSTNQIYQSPIFTNAPATFTIILPQGSMDVITNIDEIAEITSVSILNENPPEIFEVNETSETQQSQSNEGVLNLPIAQESTSKTFEGILKDKPAIKNEEPVKSKRGRKRKNQDDYSCTNSSNSEEYNPPIPKQRKERKRMQNKDAATRYRQKKKAEAEAIGGVEEKLLEVNKTLTDKAQQLSNEISYLKGLMREMFKARGLLK